MTSSPRQCVILGVSVSTVAGGGGDISFPPGTFWEHDIMWPVGLKKSVMISVLNLNDGFVVEINATGSLKPGCRM